MLAYGFNPTLESEAMDLCEFKTRLVYIANSRLVITLYSKEERREKGKDLEPWVQACSGVETDLFH